MLASSSFVIVPSDPSTVAASALKAGGPPGSRLTAEALRQYCRAHMPTFRAPKEIEIVPELPKGATGKVLTAVLRARSVQAS